MPLKLDVIDAERLSVGDNVSLRVADALIVCEIVALGEYDTLELPLELELEDTETLELSVLIVLTGTIARAMRTINLRSDAMVTKLLLTVS